MIVPIVGSLFENQLEFNVSHTAGQGVLAVAQSPVGVDIEAIRERSTLSDLVKRYFSPQEIAQFDSLPYALKPEAFFRGWTGKEAVLKAVGVGLADVDAVTVEIDPRRPAKVINYDAHPGPWSLSTWIDGDMMISIALHHASELD
jgi:4'-phosphopantetheinyl transferase